MNQLVTLKNDAIFTDSLIIAKGTKFEHHTITRKIRDYMSEFEQLGKMEFMDVRTKNPNGGRPSKVYLLNEPQASYLITLLGNNDIVRKFKLNLIKEFYKMLKILMQKQTNEWKLTREQGKLTRYNETMMINELVTYAKKQGSKHSDKLYMVYTKLARQMTGVMDRDASTVNHLNNLSLVENIIMHEIKTGMMLDKHYKEIYKDCKSRLIEFNKIAYLEVG